VYILSGFGAFGLAERRTIWCRIQRKVGHAEKTGFVAVVVRRRRRHGERTEKRDEVQERLPVV